MATPPKNYVLVVVDDDSGVNVFGPYTEDAAYSALDEFEASPLFDDEGFADVCNMRRHSELRAEIKYAVEQQ